MQVDIGCEQRTIVSECKYVMDVEDAVGKKVLIVANVPPTEVNGIKSHGEHTVHRCEFLITSVFYNLRLIFVAILLAGVVLTGFNYDPTPMPRSFKVILPGLGRLPPGSQVKGACFPWWHDETSLFSQLQFWNVLDTDWLLVLILHVLSISVHALLFEMLWDEIHYHFP